MLVAIDPVRFLYKCQVMHAFKQGHTLGQYEIIRLLGEGGMGAVYEARHVSLDRRVAIKTLHPSVACNQTSLQRFFAEAKTLSRLEHPSIVQVSDFGTEPDGTAFLVMEYLRGDSLGKRLRKFHDQGQTFHPVQAIQICWQVAEVLTIAHSKGIVHRDIKPDNLMLVADSVAPSGERVKVLDFGIAKLSGEFERGVAKTDTNALMGTPMYMSPEQCAGAGKVDDRTDVYALGCVLFQMLSGRPPFYAEGAGELIGMHLFQPPPVLLQICPQVSKPLAALVAKMLTKEKSQRPNMATIAEELRNQLNQLVGQSCIAPIPAQSSSESASASSPVIPTTTISLSSGQNTAEPRRNWRPLLLGGFVCVVSLCGVVSAVIPSSMFRAKASVQTVQPAALPPTETESERQTPKPIAEAPSSGQSSSLRMQGEQGATDAVVLNLHRAQTAEGKGSSAPEQSGEPKSTESAERAPKDSKQAVAHPQPGPRPANKGIKSPPKKNAVGDPIQAVSKPKREIRYEE